MVFEDSNKPLFDVLKHIRVDTAHNCCSLLPAFVTEGNAKLQLVEIDVFFLPTQIQGRPKCEPCSVHFFRCRALSSCLGHGPL